MMNEADPPPRPPGCGGGHANNPDWPIDRTADTDKKQENEDANPPDNNPDREWHGIKPKQTKEKEGSTSRVTVPGLEGDWFRCSGCWQLFTSRYALGGHRASHKGVKGCFQMQKQEQGESGNRAVKIGEKENQAGWSSSATARTGRLDLDLNKPAPEDDEEASPHLPSLVDTTD